MFNQSVRKNKVVLADYNYQRDIESRLLIAQLTSFEIEVLNEIVNNSLVIPIKQFAEHLNATSAELIPILEKLKPAKLFKLEKDHILIDKEVRKYYESLMVKFEEYFEHGMEFLQSQLQKIPIQILFDWYCILRTSDDIFESIVEKFLATPKTYQRYLQELQFNDPKVNKMVQMVFSAPDYTVSANEIMQACGLSHETFEEYTLLLEYYFVCCLNYRKVGNRWEEIVTPYFEWHEYLRFIRDTTPKKIMDVSNILRTHPENFGFVQDMSKLLTLLQTKPLPVEPFEEGYTLKPKDGAKQFPHASQTYQKNLIDKLLIQHLIEIDNHRIYAVEGSNEWLDKSDTDKALTLSRHPIQVEKALKNLLNGGWYYAEDFLKGFTGTLGLKDAVTLKCKGKKWRYALPAYTQQERHMIESTLCERLFEAGVVAIGTHKGKSCFSVTPFGKALLED